MLNPIIFTELNTSGSEQTRTVILWPTLTEYNGVDIYFRQNITFSVGILSTDNLTPTNTFGPTIDIQGFNSLRVNAVLQSTDGNAIDIDVPVSGTIRFQFFDDDPPGLTTEQILSSSMSGSTEINNNLLKVNYPFVDNRVIGQTNHNINYSFERTLPNAKYMRVFINFTAMTAGETFPVSYKVFVKGVLNKKESQANETSVYFRKV